MNNLAILSIQKTNFRAWEKYKHWHFLDRKPCAVDKVFVIEPNVAIIVYAYPPLASRSRRIATKSIFNTGSRSEIAQRINQNVRIISRLVVNPAYRKRRIATKLIRHTLPLVDVSFVECSTNLFGGSKCFTNAGMTRFLSPVPDLYFAVKAAYKEIGFDDLPALNFRHQKIFFEQIPKKQADRFRKVLKRYLESAHIYKIPDSLFELHMRVSSRIDQIPAYYYWFNPEKNIKMDLT